jgi:hypothetical protein
LILLWGGYIFLIGQRQYIIGICLTTIVLAYKWRLTLIKVKQLIMVGVFLIIIMVGMVYLRSLFGRTTFTDLTLTEQLSVMSTSPVVDQESLNNSLTYDLGYRLNAGNILLGLMADLPGVDMFWFKPISYSAINMFPNFLWNSKAQVYQYDLPHFISIHYGIKSDENYIVTFISVFYAMGGLPMVIFLSALFGLMIAYMDIHLVQNNSILFLVLAIGCGYGLLSIDHSIDWLFLNVRNSMLLYLLVRVTAYIKGSLKSY